MPAGRYPQLPRRQGRVEAAAVRGGDVRAARARARDRLVDLYLGSDAIAEAWPRSTGDQRGAGVDGRRVAAAVACPPAARDHDVAVDEQALACSVNEDRRDLAARIDLACTHDELSAPCLLVRVGQI